MKYSTIFKSLNRLIDSNIFDNTIESVTKYDNKIKDKQPIYDHQNFVKAAISPKVNIIIREKELASDLASFYHGAMFSPVRSTLHKAVDNGHFLTWLCFTNKLISKHLIDTVPTAKCNQNQERQSLQTTKPSDYNTTLKAIQAKFKQLKKDIPEGNCLKMFLKLKL